MAIGTAALAGEMCVVLLICISVVASVADRLLVPAPEQSGIGAGVRRVTRETLPFVIREGVGGGAGESVLDVRVTRETQLSSLNEQLGRALLVACATIALGDGGVLKGEEIRVGETGQDAMGIVASRTTTACDVNPAMRGL